MRAIDSAMVDPMRVFLNACQERTLLYQRCRHCGHVQSYARVYCSSCHRAELDWLHSTRRGRIASFTTVHRAANARFLERVPYLLALVDVDEGFRLMMNIFVSTSDQPLRIGAPVIIEFRPDEEGREIPIGAIDA